MRHPRVVSLAILSILLLGTTLVGCGGQEEQPGTAGTLDGQALVEKRCTRCHGLDQIEGAQKTADEWRANVERMVAKGAELNAEEQDVVIQYLAETYPE